MPCHSYGYIDADKNGYFLMRCVADHLKLQVFKVEDPDERDSYGRSAFNRYYYATFLIVRAGLRRMGRVSPTGEIPHASIPEMLSGSIYNTLKKSCHEAKKIGDSDTISVLSLGAEAAKTLASLMNTARSSRTTADYHPEKPIVISGHGFSLLTISSETAQNWPHKAELLINRIEAAWRQLDI